MRLCVALLLACLTAALGGCGGDGDGGAGDEVLLSELSFAEVVAAELRGEGLEATAERGLELRAQDGPNWIDVALADPFAEYRGDPDRRGEIVAEVVQEAERRFEEGISGLSFGDAEDSLMPLLKPRFAVRHFRDEPAQTPFPAALAVVYAVERKDDLTIVSPADVERWGKPLAEIHEVAVANLARQTNAQDRLLCEPSGGNELCGWASGDGYDATRMIVPDLRRQIEEVYDGPAVYAVPMEHVFVALSREIATRENTEEALRLRVKRDFSMADDPVSPELFVERNGKLVVF